MKKFYLVLFSIVILNSCKNSFEKEQNARLRLLVEDILLIEEKDFPSNTEYQLEYNPQLDERVLDYAYHALPDSVFKGSSLMHVPPIEHVTIPSVVNGVRNGSTNRVVLSSFFFNKDSTVLAFEHQFRKDTIERDLIFAFILPRMKLEVIFPIIFKPMNRAD